MGAVYHTRARGDIAGDRTRMGIRDLPFGTISTKMEETRED
jgi:hypothetical protein